MSCNTIEYPHDKGSFNSRIDAYKTELTDNDYSPQLWMGGEFGWQLPDEEEAAAKPHSPQELAGLEVFSMFFLHRKSWIHLIAEMQAGKTGVMNCLIRLMLEQNNYKKCTIPPQNIFVCTGMSDKAWEKQTKLRVPLRIRDNVYHNGSLDRLKTVLERRSETAGSLKNILIVVDESHFASMKKNRPAKIIYDYIREKCGGKTLLECNIKILTISATDPAATIGIMNNANDAAQVQLLTDVGYQSVLNLKEQKRIQPINELKEEKNVIALVKFITETFGAQNLYHIVRPSNKHASSVREWLGRAYPSASVVEWDSKSKPSKNNGDGNSMSSVAMSDINDILDYEPDQPTFIIIKNMFYASKTVIDKYVGVFYDRLGVKDDTNLQSLLGRSCGYGKSKRTHIFTSIQTVNNYITFWRNLKPDCGNLLVGDAKLLKRKMAGIVADQVGEQVVLNLTAARANPIIDEVPADDVAGKEKVKGRKRFDETQWDHTWETFTTIEGLNRWLRSNGGKQKIFKADTTDSRFFICTTASPKPCRQRVDAIEKLMAGKKTAHTAALPTWKVGKKGCTSYVAYTDENNPATVKYYGKLIRRIAE